MKQVGKYFFDDDKQVFVTIVHDTDKDEYFLRADVSDDYVVTEEIKDDRDDVFFPAFSSYEGTNNLRENISSIISIQQNGENIQPTNGVFILKNLSKITKNPSTFIIKLGEQEFISFTCSQNENNELILSGEQHKANLTAFEIKKMSQYTFDATKMPIPFSRNELLKGKKIKTDLHTHFNAILSGEDLLLLGIEHDLTIPKEWMEFLGVDVDRYDKKFITDDEPPQFKLSALKENTALNIKNRKILESCLSIPAQEQINFHGLDYIYEIRDFIAKNPNVMWEHILKIAEEYKKHGIEYSEVSYPKILRDGKYLATLTGMLKQAEDITGVKIRLLAALPRTSNEEEQQLALKNFEKIIENPYVMGMDILGHEVNSVKDFFDYIKKCTQIALKHEGTVLRIHAGECPRHQDNVLLTLYAIEEGMKEYATKNNVAINTLKYPEIRIGHGIHIGNHNTTRQKTIDLIKKTGAIIELNLTSNLSLNNIDDISLIPIKEYVDNDIDIVLSTDGMGMYKTSASEETVVAQIAGLTDVDLCKIMALEEKLIAKKQIVFDKKRKKANYNEEQKLETVKKQSADKILIKECIASKASSETKTVTSEVIEAIGNKTPIIIIGQNDMTEEQKTSIKQQLNSMIKTFDKDKYYIVTDGKAEGLSEIISSLSKEINSGLEVVGLITLEALNDNFKIDPNLTCATEAYYFGPCRKSTLCKTRNALGKGKDAYNLIKKNGFLIAFSGHQWVSDIILDINSQGGNILIVNNKEIKGEAAAKSLIGHKNIKSFETINELTKYIIPQIQSKNHLTGKNIHEKNK